MRRGGLENLTMPMEGAYFLGGGSASTTWDPATASGMTFSNGNLTATAAAGNGFCNSTTTRSSGKKYLELTYGGGVGFTTGSWYFSLVDASQSFPNGFVTAQNSLWFVNNSSTGLVAAAPTSGDVGSYAIDFTNTRIWSSINGGLWNNSAGADPATNTGGANFSAAVISGNFVFEVLLNDHSGQAATMNVGGSAFGFTPPSGFSAWG